MNVVITVEPFTLLVLVLAGLAGLGAALGVAYRRGSRPGQTWRGALDTLPVGVLVFDSRGRRIFANQAAAHMLPALEAARITQMVQAAVGGAPQSSILRGRLGEVVQAQAWRLGGAQRSVLLAIRDLTPQQQIEAGYRKFIRTLSHELLTPLTAIRSHLSYLVGTDTDLERRQSLRLVQGDLERLTRLTSNLLILSRLEMDEPAPRRPTNLVALAEEVVLQLMEQADTRRMTIRLQAEGVLPVRPMLDRDGWKQVFLNLIDNAIKYGAEGGLIEFILQLDGPELSVVVADDGPGIAPADLPHVFTDLFRAEAHRHITGSGLGLAIVQRIVERHGGRITCANEPDRGAVFRIRLPLAQNVTET